MPKAPIEKDPTPSNLTPTQVKAKAASVSLQAAGKTAKNDPTPANIAAVKKMAPSAIAAQNAATKETAAKATAATSGLDQLLAESNAAIEEGNAAAAAGDAAVAEAVQAGKDAGYQPAGTILRYKVGSKKGTRIPVYADGAGGEFEGEESIDPTNPGSTGFADDGTPQRTLAINTFRNTLALLMGETEAGQPWVDEIYNLAQGFYITGSDQAEAMNLALQEAKKKGVASAFTKRFQGVFDLQDRLNKGEAIDVPTIAEFVASQQKLADTFKAVGMPDLATLDFTGKILGLGKSVSDVTKLIDNVFSAIDNAPAALKEDLNKAFKGVTRVDIAKGILLGPEGAAALEKKVKTIEQVSAFKSQNLDISEAQGADYAAMGYTYGQTLEKAGTVAASVDNYQKLLSMRTGEKVAKEDAQASLQKSIFENNAAESERLRKIAEEEQNRFQARSGYLRSQNRSRDY